MSEKMKSEKILIVDDQSVNIDILTNLLIDEYEIIVADNGKTALEIIKKDKPDLILLDVVMPEMDGYEVLDILQNKMGINNIPVIFLTSLDSLESEERGLKCGVADYITKPFHPSILKARVRNQLKIMRQQKLLENISQIDSLTEIPNRRKFDNSYENEYQRAIKSKVPLSLLFIDVDFFKQYNDSYGHLQGDHALTVVAKTVNSNARRPSDIAARYGGEEFVVLLPDCDEKNAKKIANSIIKQVESSKILHDKSKVSDYLTVSIGGATKYIDKEPFSVELFQLADKALYNAKDLGRNRCCWW